MAETSYNNRIRNYVPFSDFAKVYKVFEAYPFYESWSENDIRKEYDFFVNNGCIFGYFLESGECTAILTMAPYEPNVHPVHFPVDERIMYISDVATAFGHRNHGYGTMLIQHAVRHLQVLGYHRAYLRTNAEGSMIIDIAKKCGFTRIYDVIQEVEKVRVNGEVEKDPRIFLECKLTK